ncbi:sigma54 specific transcriptional regulator, Fis family [Thermanaeromonas toyohensis ToBE]|uniref:Sigma54 specific transcriptional regulator, Fis family n=1 Tax=Thermanaeromonas toyohensis ToBE TaxID=698762 RepID=A0A1W1W0M6_9FIRM|nr:sigma 54-interacting transcriptional regulator [Thermanaeromonas toyohensis]SMB98911.1 sigma54 specific transcriptional regulator, Fis family [Thermanaeromonas toyohensis ToBE]
MSGIVRTITGKCRMCYACVRNCPVKAIKVVDGQAQVVPERCIACGYCVRVCSQQAKMVESEIEIVNNFLQREKTIACLAPSFVAEFHPAWPGQVVTALRKLGFYEVHEVAFGAYLVTQEYLRFLEEVGESQGLISTPCPAVVNLVQKYFPRLIPQLVPIVSPAVALGRYLKRKLGPGIKVVFIGPCVAKKDEARAEEVAGAIDAVLTYPELKQMFTERGIEITSLGDGEFDNPPPQLGRLYPIGGGLLRSAGMMADVLESRLLVIEGREDCLEFLRAANEGKMVPQLVDMLFCKGCIEGPMMQNEYSFFRRRRLVAEFTRQGLALGKQGEVRPPEVSSAITQVHLNGVNLRREFRDHRVHLPQPSEADIRAIMAELGKMGPEDELNCGACGYSSCREKAIAVYQGLAENKMCLPYLILQLQKSNLRLRQELRTVRKQFGDIVGKSLVMQEVYRLIEKVAPTDATVLIRGESGTGKELVARAIHYRSLRSDGPFVSINCAALPEALLESELFGHARGAFTGAITSKRGLFEEAHQGTLFLDEIGDISLSLQSKLLRVLQEGEFIRVGETRPRRVDVRVIAATNRDLEKAIKEGSFRPELFYRLNVVTIWLPPLRERRDDIPLLARHFLERACQRLGKEIKGFTAEAMDALVRADWPGNVRELENVVERAAILCEGDKIELGDLPRELRNRAAKAAGWAYTQGMTFKEAVEAYEIQLLLKALEESKWVQARAAEILGLKRSTLNEMLKRYRLSPKMAKIYSENRM